MKPELDILEPRDLLSTVALIGGVLTVTGSPASETIVLHETAMTIDVEGQSFALADVARIAVEAGGGWDVVRFKIDGADFLHRQYGLFDHYSYTGRSRLGGLTFGLTVDAKPVTDAFFSVSTGYRGRDGGGIIMEAGSAARMAVPPDPRPDEEGDLDDYAIVIERQRIDQLLSSMTGSRHLSHRAIAKLEKMLRRAA